MFDMEQDPQFAKFIAEAFYCDTSSGRPVFHKKKATFFENEMFCDLWQWAETNKPTSDCVQTKPIEFSRNTR